MPRRNIFEKKLLKEKEKEEIVYVNNDEKGFNEEINLQNDKCNDNINLDEVD